MIQTDLPVWPDRDQIPETEHGLVPRRVFVGQWQRYTGTEHRHIAAGMCSRHGWYERCDGGNDCQECERERAARGPSAD